MKKEKIIIFFIAALLGLLVAGGIFYTLQATKKVEPSNTKTVSILSPSPTPQPLIFLTVDRPKDEEVVNNKVLVISGKTASNAVVIVIAGSAEEVITPSLNGDFSTTSKIDEGQNIIEVTAIAPNGEKVTIKKTVTYSLEEF